MKTYFPNLVCNLLSTITRTQSASLQKNILSCCFHLLEPNESDEWRCQVFTSAMKALILSRSHDLSLSIVRLANILCANDEFPSVKTSTTNRSRSDGSFSEFLLSNSLVGELYFVSFSRILKCFLEYVFEAISIAISMWSLCQTRDDIHNEECARLAQLFLLVCRFARSSLFEPFLLSGISKINFIQVSHIQVGILSLAIFLFW